MATDGPLLSSGIYEGERYDARRNFGGWQRVTVGDVRIVPEPRTAPPVRVVETMSPVRILRGHDGVPIVDFGQNLVGTVTISGRAPRGTTVVLRHAEVLEDGALAMRPLRGAAAKDEYTFHGAGEEQWTPQFTFHGFRYVSIEGWPEPGPALTSVTANVIHSDLRRTGWFESSHEALNRFHENVVWSMRGNFLSIPTDCPQRDERLGWTGDIQAFAPAATFLFDSRTFLSSWLKDLSIEQEALGGIVPAVVPNVLGATAPLAGWGDAATVVPWVLFEEYGDREVLRQQYPSMRAWVEYVLAKAQAEQDLG